MNKCIFNPHITPQNPLGERDKDNDGGSDQQNYPTGEDEVFGKTEDDEKAGQKDAEKRPADNGDAATVVVTPQRGIDILRFGAVMGEAVKERRNEQDERDTVQDTQDLRSHQFTKFLQRKGIKELNGSNDSGKGTYTEDDSAGERGPDDDFPAAGGPLGFACDAITVQTVFELR